MVFIPLQAVGILFSLGMLYLTFLFYKKNSYSRTSFIIWAVIWLGAIVLLIIPNTLSSLVDILGASSTLNLYLALAVAFFSAVSFMNYVHVQRQGRQVEQLVRAVAMDRASKPRKK